MNKQRCTFIILFGIATLVVLIIGIGIKISQKIEAKEYYIRTSHNGKEITIVHISDLHAPKNGVSIIEIQRQIEKIAPDLILLTGDIIDSQATFEEIDQLQSFLYYIGKLSKCFAVLGNHEAINPFLQEFKHILYTNNIILLENSYKKVVIKEKDIVLIGINDGEIYNNETVIGLNNLDPDSNIILLAHRPEYWEEYISLSYSVPILTVAGHAHGGQFRVFGRGLYSPNQGFFPKYYNGKYKNKGSYMVVSRGLGDSVLPIRLYNRYHLPIIKICL